MKQLPFVPADWTISKAGFLCALSVIMLFSLEFLSSSWISHKIGMVSEHLSSSDFCRCIYRILKMSVRKRKWDGQKQGNRKQTREVEAMRQVALKITFFFFKGAFRKRVRHCLEQQNIQVLEWTFQKSAFQIVQISANLW